MLKNIMLKVMIMTTKSITSINNHQESNTYGSTDFEDNNNETDNSEQ